MTQLRILSFILVFLFAFAQQQALVHPYKHLADEQESASPQNTTGDKQSPAHSEICGKCIALSAIGAAASAQSPTLFLLPATHLLAVEVAQHFSSTVSLPYSARAPPHLTQA